MSENIKEKLKKLLRFAEDAKKRDSQAEFENAMARVQNILLQYNMELGEIDLEEKPQIGGEPLFDTRETNHQLFPKNEGGWLIRLWTVIAKHHLCLVYTVSMGKLGIVLNGENQNRELVKFIVDQCIPRIRGMAKQSWKEYEGFDKKNTYIRSFLLGCVEGLDKCLESQKRTIQNDNQQMYALVVQKSNAVTDWVYSKVRLTRGRGSTSSSSAGREAGYAAGSKMQIHKDMGTGYGGQKRLN